MTIQATNTSDLTRRLDLTLVEEDYAPKRKQILSQARRTAEIKGFRKGMVPASLIEKMYGEKALYDAVNDLINESISGYVKENNLALVGEALPCEDTPENEIRMGAEFHFAFEIAFNAPLDFTLSKEDEVAKYVVTTTKATVAAKQEALLKQYGELKEAKKAGAEDFITVDFVAGEEQILDAYVAVRNVSDECKDAFVGIKAGDELDVEIAKAFTNEADRASLFKVKKEELDTLAPVWHMTVKTVKTFAPAELCKETFDKIFGEGACADEAAFTEKVGELVASEFAQEAEFRLTNDIKAYVLAKSGVAVPEEFLKRWITLTNEKVTPEQIEEEFPRFIADYKWTVVRNFLASKNEISVKNDELLASARGYARYQYAMYGINNIPDEYVDRFAQDMLKDEKQADRIYEAVLDDKVISVCREAITVKDTKITEKKFKELN